KHGLSPHDLRAPHPTAYDTRLGLRTRSGTRPYTLSNLHSIGNDAGETSSNRPASSRRTRLQRRANARLWVARREVSPYSRCSLAIKSKTASAVRLSRSPVGSSAN